MTIEALKEFRVLRLIAVLPAMLMSLTACQMSSTWQEYEQFQSQPPCYNYDKGVFRNCVIEKFPPGSDWPSLQAFLEEKGLRDMATAEEKLENEFYYFLANKYDLTVDYEIVVVGRYDADQKIVEIAVD